MVPGGNCEYKDRFCKVVYIYIHKNDLVEWDKYMMQGRDKRE